MQKVFVYLLFFMFIFTVSCSNNVKNVVDDENVNDSVGNSDNELDTVDEETLDSQSDNETQDDSTVPDEDTIGSECSENDECSANEFCAKETGSCETSVMGNCETKPDDCYLARVISPVCGCDDYSYSSSCWAHAEGVNVKHDEQCESDVVC